MHVSSPAVDFALEAGFGGVCAKTIAAENRLTGKRNVLGTAATYLRSAILAPHGGRLQDAFCCSRQCPYAGPSGFSTSGINEGFSPPIRTVAFACKVVVVTNSTTTLEIARTAPALIGERPTAPLGSRVTNMGKACAVGITASPRRYAARLRRNWSRAQTKTSHCEYAQDRQVPKST